MERIVREIEKSHQIKGYQHFVNGPNKTLFLFVDPEKEAEVPRGTRILTGIFGGKEKRESDRRFANHDALDALAKRVKGLLDNIAKENGIKPSDANLRVDRALFSNDLAARLGCRAHLSILGSNDEGNLLIGRLREILEKRKLKEIKFVSN